MRLFKIYKRLLKFWLPNFNYQNMVYARVLGPSFKFIFSLWVCVVQLFFSHLAGPTSLFAFNFRSDSTRHSISNSINASVAFQRLYGHGSANACLMAPPATFLNGRLGVQTQLDPSNVPWLPSSSERLPILMNDGIYIVAFFRYVPQSPGLSSLSKKV